MRIGGSIDAVADCLERRRWLVVGAWSVLYFAVTGFLAARKLFWDDEFFTLNLSRIARFSELWTALLTGADQHPPFFYRLTHLSLAAFGENHLALRLPAALGFWLLMLCLYAVVSRRTSPLFGFAAMLFPIATRAYEYAYEARGYGLVLGFSALAVLGWQRASEGDRRRLGLAGLAIGLAGAVASHYYALFVVLPLALGEAVRSVRLRRLDVAVWLALAAPAIPLLAFLPVIRAGFGYAPAFWAAPRWLGWLDYLTTVFTPTIVPAAGLLALLGVALACSAFPAVGSERRVSPPPAHETIVALGLVALPLLQLLLAKLFTNAFHWRYALPAVIGWSILVAFVAYRMAEGGRRVALAMTFAFGASLLLAPLLGLRSIAHDRRELESVTALLTRHDDEGLAVALVGGGQFYRFSHYAPAAVAHRLVYLADPGSELKYLHHDTVDRGLLELRPWNRLNVAEYSSFVARGQPFLAYGWIDEGWTWLPDRLLDDGFDLRLLDRDPFGLLYRVTPRSTAVKPPTP